MQVWLKVGSRTFGVTVAGLLALAVLVFMLTTYGEAFLDGFSDGIRGVEPRGAGS